MTVRTVSQRDIPKLVSGVVSSTRVGIDGMLKGRHQFSFGNSTVQCQPIDAVRWATETIPDSPKSLHIRNIMVNAVIDSEAFQGSSAVVCAAALTAILRVPRTQEAIAQAKRDLTAISTHSRRASSEEILEIMAKLDRDPLSYRIARTAIDMCSSNASIQVVKGEGRTVAKTVSGYKFQVVVPEQFLATASQQGERTLTCAKTLVIDGFVESMSEVDGTVQRSYETKTPLIIIARGYSPDVLHTLAVNYSNGHLAVVPLVMPFDELGINMINDIAVVLNAEIVSSTKGETISSRKWDDLNIVQVARVGFSNSSIVIEDESRRGAVSVQRKFLRDQRKAADSDSVRELYDKRISCLMGEGVSVEMGADLKDLAGIYTDRVNSHIRNYRSGAKWGIIDLSSCTSSVKSHLMSEVLVRLKTVSSVYTTKSLLIGIQTALTCATHIGQIGGIIYNDRRK